MIPATIYNRKPKSMNLLASFIFIFSLNFDKLYEQKLLDEQKNTQLLQLLLLGKGAFFLLKPGNFVQAQCN